MEYRRRTADDDLGDAGLDAATSLDRARAALADGRADEGLVLAESARDRLVTSGADDVARADFVVGVALGQRGRDPRDVLDAVALLDGAAAWFAGRDDHWNEAMALVNAGTVTGDWSTGDDALFQPADPLDRLQRAARAAEQAGDSVVQAVASAGVRVGEQLGAPDWIEWFRGLAGGPPPEPQQHQHTGTDDLAADDFAAARAAMAEDDRDRALGELRSTVARTGAMPPLDVLAWVADAYGVTDLADTCRRVHQAGLDPKALFDVGYALVEANLNSLAVPFLEELDRLQPGNPQVVAELAVALEGSGRHRDAAAVLEANPAAVAGEFMIGYLLVFNCFMAGDLDRARRHFEQLARPPAVHDGGAGAGPTVMYERLEGMVRRSGVAAGATRLDHTDLRGWHFVLTGGLLTGTFDSGGDDGMNGRFAYVFDSYANLRLGIDRLRAVLATWGATPPVVLAMPDRNSQALGIAAGQVLGLPVETWSPTAGAGLVVAHDLAEVGVDLSPLAANQPGQVLFVHAASWTNPPPVAPDVVTLLHQHASKPWDPNMRMVEGADGQMVREDLPADDSPPAVLAEHIVAADPGLAHVSSDEAAVVAFARAVAAEAAGTRSGGLRERLWESGPVPSARFA